MDDIPGKAAIPEVSDDNSAPSTSWPSSSKLEFLKAELDDDAPSSSKLEFFKAELDDDDEDDEEVDEEKKDAVVSLNMKKKCGKEKAEISCVFFQLENAY